LSVGSFALLDVVAPYVLGGAAIGDRCTSSFPRCSSSTSRQRSTTKASSSPAWRASAPT
jgi:hypothetical protein